MNDSRSDTEATHQHKWRPVGMTDPPDHYECAGPGCTATIPAPLRSCTCGSCDYCDSFERVFVPASDLVRVEAERQKLADALSLIEHACDPPRGDIERYVLDKAREALNGTTLASTAAPGVTPGHTGGPVGESNHEDLTVWRCRQCTTVSDHIGVTIDKCFNCGAESSTWQRLRVRIVWDSENGDRDSADPHREELAAAVRDAIRHERAMRVKQLAHGGWVEQVCEAAKATDAAVAALVLVKPTYHHATRVIHASVEGNEDMIEVFTPDAWLVICVDKAEIVHKDYKVRKEGFRWHPSK